jgi:hypothetical protein
MRRRCWRGRFAFALLFSSFNPNRPRNTWVPQRPAGFDPDFETVHGQHAIFRQARSESALEEWRKSVVSKMFSLSNFMKALKQRFSKWYNRKEGRSGPLRESRLKSLIMEDEGLARYGDLHRPESGAGWDGG